MPNQSAHGALAKANPEFETIHVNMLSEFTALVDALGGKAEAMLAAMGLPPEDRRPRQLRPTYRQFVGLLELAATELGCADFGMQLAVRQARNAFRGALGDGMRAARNLDEALNFVCNHSYAHSLAAWIWRRPSRSGQNIVVGHDILLEGLPQKGQAMEYMMLVGTINTIDLTDGRARARCVLFRHQPISPLKTYRRYFGCEVRFGRGVDAGVYSEHDLACPIRAPDAQAYQIAGDMIEARFARHKPPLHACIRGMVTHTLGGEYCTKEHVAAGQGLHPRTMARRLAQEGTSFQLIKDQVRRDRMLYYIQQTGLDFTAISERLGFSEQAVMTRSCHKWFGLSPTALRAAETSRFVPIGQAAASGAAQQRSQMPFAGESS